MPSRMPMCAVTHRFAKRSLLCLNVFYMISATIMILVASCGRYQTFLTSHYLFGAIIGIGAFLIALSAAGLWGTVRHSQVILFFYIIVLFIVFAVQFGVACSCLAMLSSGAQGQRTALLEAIWSHIGVSAQRDIQMSLNCCGFYDAVVLKGPMSHPECSDLPQCFGSAEPCCVGSTGLQHSKPVRRAFSELTTTTVPNLTTISVPSSMNQIVVSTGNSSCPVEAICQPLIGSHVNAALRLVGALGVLFALFEFAGLFLTYRYRNMRDPRLYERATKAWGTDLLSSDGELHAALEIS